MNTALNAASALALCAFLLAGGVAAQTQPAPPATPETEKPPPPRHSFDTA
jgi:invasion protein IalB